MGDPRDTSTADPAQVEEDVKATGTDKPSTDTETMVDYGVNGDDGTQGGTTGPGGTPIGG